LDLLADVLVHEGSGTQIADTQVTSLNDVPAFGDGSFALRISGTARFEEGVTTAFIADVVFLHAGRVTGSVMTVAYGQAPRRDALLALVERFAQRIHGELA
jgi:hypothetical protein